MLRARSSPGARRFTFSIHTQGDQLTNIIRIARNENNFNQDYRIVSENNQLSTELRLVIINRLNTPCDALSTNRCRNGV